MIKQFFNWNHFIRLLFIFQSIKFIFSDIELNRIISLGGDQFKYSHFSFNSNGDMIIDSSTYPKTNERRFFGLRNNGRYYFNDSINNEFGYYSIFSSNPIGKIEGESYIIQLTSSYSDFNGRELLCGISKDSDSSEYYYEIFNLESKNMSIYRNSVFFGKIISDSFTFIKLPDESNSNYHYIISYITKVSTNYYLYTKIVNFSFENQNGFAIIIDGKSIEVADEKIVSCFFTEKLVYLCFYLNTDNKLCIRVFNTDFSDTVRTLIYEPTDYNPYIFFKGILLKEEIGFFIFFKESTSTFPVVSLMKYNDNLEMENYNNFNQIEIGQATFNLNHLLNDIIRLNDFQICYISTDPTNIELLIVIFTLYKDDTLMNVRYYSIKMWETYKIKIYQNIKASLYKNFISVAFSHCIENMYIS